MGNKNTESIYETLAKAIKVSDLTDEKKTEALSRLLKVKETPVNILLVGPTAAGKSSTINAIFNMEKAKIGTGVEPETTRITRYDIENISLYDAPGLGDSAVKDKLYTQMIKNQLMAMDDKGNPVIDLVLVIGDASQKDLGTVFGCINDVLIPVLGKEAEKRILIALNKADIAMSGRHWDETLNSPDSVLTDYLDKKVSSIQRRIYDTTGISFCPIYYAAGYKEEGQEQVPYNIIKLLSTIVAAIPKEKRLAMADVLNPDPAMWQFSDGFQDYQENTSKSFWESVKFLFSNLGVTFKVTFKRIGAIFTSFFNGIFR